MGLKNSNSKTARPFILLVHKVLLLGMDGLKMGNSLVQDLSKQPGAISSGEHKGSRRRE
jgi:hypothetical protein